MMRAGVGLVLLGVLFSGILVTGCPSTDPRIEPTAPDALFTASPRTGYPPLRVQFTDLSKPGASEIRSWFWDFGDGTTSMDRNPSHVYYIPGSYSVSLTVTTGIGSKTLRLNNYIVLQQASSVAAVGPEGGEVAADGAKVTVPPKALSREAVIGITPGQGAVTVTASQGEVQVSGVYTISHDQQRLFGDVRYPMVLEMAFNTKMVPEENQNGTQLQILATQNDGITIPIVGEVADGLVRAVISGMPPSAAYAVIFRPQATITSFPVDLQVKAPTSYVWKTNAWRLNYGTQALQALTALRIGTLSSTRSYDRRTWSQGQMDATAADVQDVIANVHLISQQTGFISPALVPTVDNEFQLIFYPLNAQPVTDYDSISQLTLSTSVFGQMVIDPGQCIAVCKKNAVLSYDQMQEMDFINVFAQELTHAMFRGYDYPEFYVEAPLDLDAFNKPVQVPYYYAFEKGIGTYVGQLAGNVLMARSLGANEYSYISAPLLAPYSNVMPGYASAGQDFFFYVARRFELDDLTSAGSNPLAYIGDSYDGILELMRERTRMAGANSFDDALTACYEATDIALQRFFGKTLADVYWEYAQNRAYENADFSVLRPTDIIRPEYTLNTDRFEPDALVKYSFNEPNVTITFSGDSHESLANIPPLSTRALVLSAGSIYGELDVNVNLYDWTPDNNQNSMRVKIYKLGEDGQELSPQDSQITLPHFGEPVTGGFAQAVILISNVTSDRAYNAVITAKVRGEGGVTIPTTGTVGGLVTVAGGGSAIEGVTVEGRTASGTSLGTTTTLPSGIYSFLNVPVGDATFTFTKTGYRSISRSISVLPSPQITILSVELERN